MGGSREHDHQTDRHTDHTNPSVATDRIS